ncbi:hypothetical protein J6590_105758, partial [Homalodisca vitripennis]
DETWVYGYDFETKDSSTQWRHSGSSKPQKGSTCVVKVKFLFKVFFDFNDIVDHEFYCLAGLKITIQRGSLEDVPMVMVLNNIQSRQSVQYLVEAAE